MKYYKFIELPGWQTTAQTLLDYFENQTDIIKNKIFWNVLTVDNHKIVFDKVEQLLSPYNLKVKRAILLVIFNDSIPIHQDNNYSPVARINIPLLNCENSFTNFYTSSDHPETNNDFLPDTGTPYIAHRPEKCILEDQIEVTTPVVMNVQSVHNVVTNNPIRPRIMLSIQTTPDAGILLEE